MDLIFARFLEQVSDLCRLTAMEIRTAAKGGTVAHADVLAPGYEHEPEPAVHKAEPDRRPEPVPDLVGYLQREIVELLRKAGAPGANAAEMRAKTTSKTTSILATLRRLVDLDIAEIIPGRRPTRWRLAPRYRSVDGG